MKKVKCIAGVLLMTVLIGNSSNVFASEGEKIIVQLEKNVTLANCEVSEPMTAQEMAEEFAKDVNISIEDAYEQLGIEQSQAKDTRATKYRTLGATVDVTDSYKPTAKFYCMTSESGNYWGIVEIKNVTLDRTYNGNSKQFSGQVYANLENAYTIYYSVSGDFYNNGTTTVTSSGSVGAAGTSVSYGVSESSNHYKTIYYENRLVVAH